MGKTQENSKKIGRPEEIKLDDLQARFNDMKWFLENYWGRIWLGLKRVSKPQDVGTLFRSIPGIEWCKPFKGHAVCFIADKITKAKPAEIRVTRQKWKELAKREETRWSEYHDVSQKAQVAVNAVKTTISEFYEARETLLFFQIVNIIAATLSVQNLTAQSSRLLTEINAIREQKDTLRANLNEQEGWFAQNEIVKFAKNRRWSNTLLNCARALAGMPEWGWFHSRRTCEKFITVQPRTAAPYELFQLLHKIIRKTRPLKLSRVEATLKAALLFPENAMLRAYVGPQWYYVQESIHSCVGVKKSEVACAIMDRFAYHCDRPKTATEAEIARLNQLP